MKKKYNTFIELIDAKDDTKAFKFLNGLHQIQCMTLFFMVITSGDDSRIQPVKDFIMRQHGKNIFEGVGNIWK